MKLTPGGSTDKGQVRDGNEDGYVVDRRLQLYAVADGMGGHRAGEVAERDRARSAARRDRVGHRPGRCDHEREHCSA